MPPLRDSRGGRQESVVPDRRLGDARGARGRGSARAPRPAARSRARLVAPRARRLARDEAGSRAPRDARRRDVHGRRPAVLDGAGRRAEHALARRRRARAPSFALRPALPARAGARAVHRRSSRTSASGSSTRSRRAARPTCATALTGPLSVDAMAVALGLDDLPADVPLGLVRRDRGGRDRHHRGTRRRPAKAPRRSPSCGRALEPVLDREPASSLLAARGTWRGGPRPRGGRLECRGAALRRDRDDRRDDRERAPPRPRERGRAARRSRRARRSSGTPSRSRCGSSPRPR